METLHKVGFDIHLGQSCGCVKQGGIYYGGNEMIALNGTLNHYQMMDRLFYEISAEILTCDSVEKIRKALDKVMPPNITCLINGTFLDVDNNPVLEERGDPFDEEMCIIFDGSEHLWGKEGKKLSAETWNISEEGLLPNMERLLEEGLPLVFNSLSFGNRAIGYVCTYLPVQKHEYLSIPQYAIGISNALGGFRNTKYQSYLNSRIESIYTHDALTGLYNRHGFYKYCEMVLQEMQDRKQQKLLVLSADLDGLKTINDCYGHLEGDNAIYIAAKALQEVCPEDGIAFRFGGDEMVCLVPVTGEESPEKMIRERIASFLEEYNNSSGKPYKVSLSLGFCLESVSDFDTDDVIKNADMKMYAEKKAKKVSRSN